ncbi:uncharacterized protein [Spinacia oleracea]|uniref:Uncharacterized protein isoform X1 n=1 Tax=Spinacia oleracea TaxID=3562 RepID=A0A9R0K878_SPIOL|nr:uncharacterized protein LOC110801103 isoform X1 [Spinacia oleracea]
MLSAANIVNMPSSALRSLKKRENVAGARPDPGWEHVTEADGDPTKIRCKYCGVVSGGIFRLKHHLVGTRYNVEPCLQVPDDVKLVFKQLLETNAEKSSRKKKILNDIGEEEEEYKLRRGGTGMDCFVNRSNPRLQSTLNQKY